MNRFHEICQKLRHALNKWLGFKKKPQNFTRAVTFFALSFAFFLNLLRLVLQKGKHKKKSAEAEDAESVAMDNR